MIDRDLNEILLDDAEMSEDESEESLGTSIQDIQAAEEEYDNEDEDLDALFEDEDDDDYDDDEDEDEEDENDFDEDDNF